ncbi:tol-pal system protein YbgF [Granulosicoccaceae sp. 1_MG-2023]|nr:tol-pal system protein YbgF [Granulosicoccaceae sp. 1_MG-2023]
MMQKRWLALCALTALSVAAPVQSAKAPDNAALDQRLQRVERILDNQVLLDMLQRMDSLQNEVRQLRGELERLNHEQSNLSKRQRDLYLDTDRRIQALEGGNTGLTPDLSAGAPLTAAPEALAVTEEAVEAPEAVVAPVEQRSQAEPGEQAAYQEAYDTLMAGNNQLAVERFDAFLAKYSDGPYSDNALYWRGEAYYVSRRFEDAVASFKEVISRFPDSPKIPDARLKIAYAYYEQGQQDESRAELQTLVQQHPDTTAARLAQRRLNAMSE